MLKTIGGVVLGYVAMALVVFAALTAAYAALGADGAFRPGSYDVTPLWVVVSLVTGFVAALLGGWVARRVSGSASGPRALAVVVIVLGLLIAVPALSGGRAAPGPRTGTPGNTEAMQQAQTPVWLMLLNPLVGALGVLVGGRGRVAGEPRVDGGAARVG